MSRQLLSFTATSHPCRRVFTERDAVTDATQQEFSTRSTSFWTVLFIASFLCGTGCATTPYQYGRFLADTDEPPAEVVFEYGRPHKTLDNIAWATGIWSRVLFMNCGMNKHELSEKTRDKLVSYLEENELNDVLVRVNQYDPKGEWHRLRENEFVSPGWRYSFGTLSLVQYTLIPGRILGGDHYNPFTNTLYINSDVPAVVLHEAAYAKDVHGRPMPGTYAVLNEIPVVSLWRRTWCVNDVLGYARANNDWLMEDETYRVVYPQMGAQSTGLASTFVPFWDSMILHVAGAAAGHATGRMAIYNHSKAQRSETDEFISGSEGEPEVLQAAQIRDHVEEDVIQFTKHETETWDDR